MIPTIPAIPAPPPLTPAELEELERTAKAATPGPWIADDPYEGDCGLEVSIGYGEDRGARFFEEMIATVYSTNLTPSEFAANAAHIAACDPLTILSLLSQLRVMREALESAAEKFDDYARQHNAKGTVEGAQKAAANEYMGRQMRSALSTGRGE